MSAHQGALQMLGGAVFLASLAACGFMVWLTYHFQSGRPSGPASASPLQTELEEICQLIEARLGRIADPTISVIMRARFDIVRRMRDEEGLRMCRALLIEVDSMLDPDSRPTTSGPPPSVPVLRATTLTFRDYLEQDGHWREALAARAVCSHIDDKIIRVLGRRQTGPSLPDSLLGWREFVDSGGLKGWLDGVATQLESRLGAEQRKAVLEQGARCVSRVYPIDHLPRILESFPKDCLLEERNLAVTSRIMHRQLQESSQKLRVALAGIQNEKENMRLLLDSTAEAIYGVDLKGDCVFVNRSCLSLLKYDKEEEVLGRNMHALIHHSRSDGSPLPVERCRIYQAFRENKQSHIDDEVVWRSDGTKCDVEYWSYPIFRSGEVAGAVVSVIDITERKRRDEQLQLFRNLVDRSNDAIYLIDALTARFLDVNEKACLSLGYSRKELLGLQVTHIEAVLPDRFSWGAHVEELRKRESLILEGAHRRKDGSVFPVEVTIRYIELKQHAYIIAVARDVSERKRMERIMVQSEKLSAVGRLAAGVAHEINNPLGVILGFAEGIARRVKDGDPLSMPLKSIEREAVRCKNLVQDLLNFSRHGAAQFENLDLNAAINGVISIIQTQARLGRVRVVAELNALPPCMGDRNKLQQVVVNLCNNALDAMPAGGQLTIRTSMKDGSTIALEVRDTGAGIPESIRDKIFDPFFTTKEPGKGTGLGLALVHECVHKHGGTIEVGSVLGKGTTFTIHLPAVESASGNGKIS